MVRSALALLIAGALFALPSPARAGFAPPDHSVVVTGVGITDANVYPAFSPTIERYGVTTTSSTAGTITITATTSDSGGVVLVNGKPAAGGQATVTGLTEGDEVSVIFDDAGGIARHSYVYLPPEFPKMDTVVDEPGNTPGDVLLTLSKFTGTTPDFEVAMDPNGVPSYVRSSTPGKIPLDLKPAFGGGYSVSRPSAVSAGRTGQAAVLLNEKFEQVKVFETAGGLVNTDGHDAILRADGSRILIGYEPNAATNLIDSVIQEVDAAGNVIFTWNSGDYVVPADETVQPTVDTMKGDYAHINSIQVMDDGDILASFRHFSSVFKIAWSDRPGISKGDVVWKLGGRDSDFTFVNDPHPGGPCAQHTANQLANGNILIFDNGSIDMPNSAYGNFDPYCLDPNDLTGAPIERPITRITEYAINPGTGVADLVWEYAPNPGSQSPNEAQMLATFAGSVRRLDSGNTLIGWASAKFATATEVDPAGNVVWEIKNNAGYFTYRAEKVAVPDAMAPVVKMTAPADGAKMLQGAKVALDFTCSDRGGSSLSTCTGQRGYLDTSTVGTVDYSVTAEDGAGNVTTQTRTYTVQPKNYRVDTQIKRPSGTWMGNGVYGSYSRQSYTLDFAKSGARRNVYMRLENEGNSADQMTLFGVASSGKFGVRYFVGGVNVTTRVVAGTYKTAVIPAGGYRTVHVEITRLKLARPGDIRMFSVRATSVGNPQRRDAVGAAARATR